MQFNEEIKVKVLESESHSETNGTAPVTEIDESRIDRLLHLLHEADPQAEKCDSEELLTLEGSFGIAFLLAKTNIIVFLFL